MVEKDFWKVVGAFFSGILLFALLKYLEINNGFLRTVTVALLILGFLSHKFGVVGVTLRKIFMTVATTLFLLSWPSTGPTANWIRNMIEKKAPRTTFDARAETLTATSKFVRNLDGTLQKVPMDWNFDSELPVQTMPATPELAREYARQQARTGSRQEDLSGLCTMVWEGDGEAVSLRGRRDRYDQRRLEFSSRGRKYLIRWDESGTGTWEDMRGTTRGKVFDLVLNEKTNILRGKSSEDGMSQRGSASFVLECPTDEPAYTLGSVSRPAPKEERQTQTAEGSLPMRVTKVADKQGWKNLR